MDLSIIGVLSEHSNPVEDGKRDGTNTVKFFAQKAKTIPAQSRDDLEYKEMI